MRRRSTWVWALFGAPALLAILACGLGDRVTQAAFETACTEECVRAGADRSACQPYCECGYRWASENDKLQELQNVQVVPGQRMPPVMVDLMSECGSDLWDSNFRRECVRSCTEGAICPERCDCFLRQLRGEGPRNASTRFLVENLDVDPVTPQGQARIDTAEQICPP